MANEEHVEIVRKGREAIADWSACDRGEAMDLSGADLTEVDLTADRGITGLVGAELHGANLRGAILARARLQGANLELADLSKADLSEADLSAARLSGARLAGAELYLADLSVAQLGHADLTGASLDGTNLWEASLRGAALHGARLGGTILGDTDLFGATGLESVNHVGDSVLDFCTIARSGKLPLSFLRGCGLPERVIEYLPSLMGEAIEFYSCFISYSSKDQAFAERLHADLQDKGVRCWFAPEDMKIGDRTRLRIDESIKLHDKLLLILSEHSVASQWVEQEVETALGKERKAKEDGRERTVLFPIRVDDSVMEMEGDWPAYIRNTRHIGDFRRWEEHGAYQEAFERLLRDLTSEDGEAEGEV